MAVEERAPAPRAHRPATSWASASSWRPCASSHAAARRWSVRISSSGSGSRAFAYSRMSPWSANQPGSPGSGWRNRARRASPSSSAGRVGDAGRLEQRAAEPLEVDGPGERGPDGVRRGRDDLLGEVGEQRALGALEPVEDGLAAARRRGAERLDREPDRGGPAVGRAEDPGRGVAGRVARDDVGGQERRDERLDLVGRERERGAADVRDLALGAQALDPERRVVARDEEHVEVVRGEPDERLDEPPRAGRAVDLVGVVEHEQQLVVAGVLERVRDERRGGLAALLRLRVVARVDRGRDRRGEVLGERLGAGAAAPRRPRPRTCRGGGPSRRPCTRRCSGCGRRAPRGCSSRTRRPRR